MTLGVATAHDLHLKLLPQLREIARCRLERTGRRPSAETLGRWWELLRPDREPPEDKFGPGLPGVASCARSSPTWNGCNSPMELSEVGRISNRVLDEVERAVIGKRDALELLLLGLLADGHVLIEDYPGLAKTLMARSFAQVTSLDFSRIQFTPDLMPSDVTGSSVYNQREGDFEFRPGPIFANLLLADEINRAPPKTQAALLEAMQERQVTSEGRDSKARAAVPRTRHPEPDRVRGHIPSAGGAARPLPPAHVGGLSGARGRVAGARDPGRARP